MFETQKHHLCDTTLYICTEILKVALLRSFLERDLFMWQFKCSFTNQNCEKLVSISMFAAYETTPSRPHLALFTCLFLLMSFLGVAMYCTDRRRPQRVCEELEAALAVYLLHMKQLLWGCWIWLTMQWLRPTTGGDIFLFQTPNVFLSWKEPRPKTPQPFGTALHTVCSGEPLTQWKRGKCVIPEICSFHICLYICTKVAGRPLFI